MKRHEPIYFTFEAGDNSTGTAESGTLSEQLEEAASQAIKRFLDRNDKRGEIECQACDDRKWTTVKLEN